MSSFAPPIAIPPGMGDPGPLKKLVVPKAADAAVKKARAWPKAKLKAIQGTSQDRLAALFSPAIAKEIRREKSRLGLLVADRPELEKVLADIKEDERGRSGKVLTDAEARETAIESGRFDHLLPGQQFNILEHRGLAGPPVVFDRANTGSWSPDPDKAVGALIPDKPGVYVFAVTWAGFTDDSRDLHTVSVERRADGSTSVLSGGFSQTASPDVKAALNVPVLDANPSRAGSRAVLVYPLNPTPAGPPAKPK
jgi:hypothetical protein